MDAGVETKDTFAVVLGEDEWILEHNGARLESFGNQHQAKRAAAALARMLQRRGRDAVVLVENEREDVCSTSLVVPAVGISACAKLSLDAVPGARAMETLLPLVL